MIKSLLIAALLGLGAMTPAAAHIVYTVTSVPSDPQEDPVLLAQASLLDFVTQDVLVTPPRLKTCAYFQIQCHSLQFFADTSTSGLTLEPYAGLGFNYTIPGGTATAYLYFEQSAFSTVGSHIGIWGTTQLTVTQVPEPATFALMAMAAPALLLRRRRKQQERDRS